MTDAPEVQLAVVAQRLTDLTASQREISTEVKEMRAEVSTMASRDSADLLRFQQLDARVSRLERGALWVIGIVLAAVAGLVLANAGISPP